MKMTNTQQAVAECLTIKQQQEENKRSVCALCGVPEAGIA
jgi:hypothetical protein